MNSPSLTLETKSVKKFIKINICSIWLFLSLNNVCNQFLTQIYAHVDECSAHRNNFFITESPIILFIIIVNVIVIKSKYKYHRLIIFTGKNRAAMNKYVLLLLLHCCGDSALSTGQRRVIHSAVTLLLHTHVRIFDSVANYFHIYCTVQCRLHTFCNNMLQCNMLYIMYITLM